MRWGTANLRGQRRRNIEGTDTVPLYRTSASESLMLGGGCALPERNADSGQRPSFLEELTPSPVKFDLARCTHFGFVQSLRDLSAYARVTRF